MSQSSSSRTVASVVQGVKGNEYIIYYEGKRMCVKNGTDITFSIGSPIWLHIPNDINNAFIISLVINKQISY